MPYYPDSLDWSLDMKDLMKRYDELCKQAHEAYSNIKRFQQSKIDKQAAESMGFSIIDSLTFLKQKEAYLAGNKNWITKTSSENSLL